jgi:hypothetical protein
VGALLLAGAAPPRTAADERVSRYRQTIDLAAGVGDGVATGAISWNHVHELLPRVSAGLGARFATFAGTSRQRYGTAPKDLVDAGRVHDLRVRAPLASSLNLAVVGTVRLFRGIEAGLDIDLLGVAFGASRGAISASPDPRFSGEVRADVPALNAFLVGARDRGQLDSGFFLAFWPTDRLVIRAGLSHFVTEYRTERALDDGNRRFRLSANLGFVAVGWRLD